MVESSKKNSDSNLSDPDLSDSGLPESDQASGEEIGNSKSTVIPAEGRLAGIDFGTVRIGVAVTDPGRMIASPLDNYQRVNETADAQYFRDVVEEERIVGLIVGLPLHTDGNESQKSKEARAFGRWLSAQTDLPVDFFDERFTSTFAHEILSQGGMTNKKKKKRLDKLAAQIMLTAYLESNKK